MLQMSPGRDLEHLAKQVKVKLDEEGPIKDVMVQQKQHSRTFTFVLGSGVASPPRRTLSRPEQLTDLTFFLASSNFWMRTSENSYKFH